MYIVRVIPIRRGIPADILSYFSVAALPAGTLVTVPVRKRPTPAIVVENVPANTLKSEVRGAPFTLRGIGQPKAIRLLLPTFMAACHDVASYYVASPGAVLASLVPATVLEQAPKLKEIPEKKDDQPETPVAEKASAPLLPYILQADEGDRLGHYKSIIRSEFARKRSVLFLLPTIQEGVRFFETLSKGIEDYTLVFNAEMPKKALISSWNRSIEETHPLLIIATGSFLCLPRTDIGTIVVERESAGIYKRETRPFVDVRLAAERLARHSGARIIFGDILLRTETLARVSQGEATELVPLTFRLSSGARAELVDMKKYKSLEEPEFRIISAELEELVRGNRERNEHLFIFCARRGLAPTTVCGDCGAAVFCSVCKGPVVLHRTSSTRKTDSDEGDGEPFFLCHRCGERRSAAERCAVCNSWNLRTLSIGIELVAEALESLFPRLSIIRIDADSIEMTKTKRRDEARLRADTFYNSPGAVLLGTELALPYLDRPIENTAVATADSLFSIPDFRINERIMNLLLRLRSLAQKHFLVQTRVAGQKVIQHSVSGNAADFYREELAERQRLHYPPATTLIKITVRGEKDEVEQDITDLAKQLAEFKPTVFAAFGAESARGLYTSHALLKLPRGQWSQLKTSPTGNVGRQLAAELAALPARCSIVIDPESLL